MDSLEGDVGCWHVAAAAVVCTAQKDSVEFGLDIDFVVDRTVVAGAAVADVEAVDYAFGG